MGSSVSLPSPAELPADDRRRTLDGNVSIAGFANLLRSGRVKSLVVLAGAGISVSAGIPDFRTPGTGLYSNLQKYALRRPEDVFDISFFAGNPRPFFHLARELYPGRFFPTRTHFFLRLLESKGLLRRLYTQNIDTLERQAGLSGDRVIEAHGSFASATCRSCGARYSQEWVERRIFGGGRAPVAAGDDCSSEVDAAASALASLSVSGAGATPAATTSPAAVGVGASSTSSSSSLAADLAAVVVPRCEAPSGCTGIVKPDITFFGEDLPDRYANNVGPDCAAADALIVLGTSLKVFPVASIPSKVGALCPRLLINREAVSTEPPENDTAAEAPATTAAGRDDDDDDADDDDDDLRVDTPRSSNTAFRFGLRDNYRDVFLQGDCDDGCEALAAALGWTDDLNRIHADAIDEFAAAHPGWQRVAIPSPAASAAAAAAHGIAVPSTPTRAGGAKATATAAASASSPATRGVVAASPHKPGTTKPAVAARPSPGGSSTTATTTSSTTTSGKAVGSPASGAAKEATVTPVRGAVPVARSPGSPASSSSARSSPATSSPATSPATAAAASASGARPRGASGGIAAAGAVRRSPVLGSTPVRPLASGGPAASSSSSSSSSSPGTTTSRSPSAPAPASSSSATAAAGGRARGGSGASHGTPSPSGERSTGSSASPAAPAPAAVATGKHA